MKCKNCGKKITNPLYASLGYGEECLGKVQLMGNKKLVIPDMSFIKKDAELYKVIDRGEFYKNLNTNFNKALSSKHSAIKSSYKLMLDVRAKNKKEEVKGLSTLLEISNDLQLKKGPKERAGKEYETIDLNTVGLLHCNPEELLSDALKDQNVDTLPFSHLKYITDNLPLTEETANYIHEELGINEDEENE